MLRRAAFSLGIKSSYTLPQPVIVVGNISVGGTGKTPLVAALCEALQRAGRTPGIITRGYGAHGTTQAGLADEATLLHTRTGAPVVANAARVTAGETLLTEHPDVNVIISDDGLQHLALSRDIEIAVVDGARGFGNGFLLPAGPLRERVSRLNHVDCIVLNDALSLMAVQDENTSKDGHLQAQLPENARQMASFNALQNMLAASGKPVFTMRYDNERFVSLANETRMSPAHFIAAAARKRVAAIAGIGHPQRFFAHLATLGANLESTHAFPDHHAFTEEDFANIDAELILMTEKDAVKCHALPDALKSRMWMMQIDAVLPAAFTEFILKRLRDVTRPEAA